MSAARKWFKKYHKWPAIILSIFILLFSVSGIILNHRKLFSSVDVSRGLLPPIYRYQQFNLAAIKSGIYLSGDSILLYGNLGVWLTDNDFRNFKEINNGFPRGVDQHKINSLCRTKEGRVFAGTLLGLYEMDLGSWSWKKVDLPCEEERINKVQEIHDSLFVLTRSHLLATSLAGRNLSFSQKFIPPAENDDHKIGLFRTLWVIHSGEIYGQAGRLFIDFVGFVFIFLTLTGIIYFVTPWLLKRLKNSGKSRWKRFNRFSLKWHNLTGSWLILILILTTLTGMFLRPPLLIAIANARVGKIPFSVLNDPNPWNDRLRDFLYDEDRHVFIFSTSEGMFFSTRELKDPFLEPFRYEPPVSVMGITVLEKCDSLQYMIGSFSGLFRWNPADGSIINNLTGSPYQDPGNGRPFGDDAISGYFKMNDGTELIFDYGKGLKLRADAGSIHLDTKISNLRTLGQRIDQPMSLWNLALEIHTCRIYQPLISDFYVLLIPLMGLGITFVLITGFFSWFLGRRSRKKAVNLE